MFRNLNAELARKGMSTMNLADVLGVSKKTANNKLSGRSEFTLSEIKKISGIFPGASLDYLFDDGTEARPTA